VYVGRNEKEQHHSDASSYGNIKSSHIDAIPSPASDNVRIY